MPYIYKIENDINQKLYIGKTVKSLEERFKEHCKDSQREKMSNRPLYAAMRKYGTEHFHISLIEESSAEDLNDREIYWINYYNSYHYGYNATHGGDGKILYDYSVVYEAYKQNDCNCNKTASALNMIPETVSKIVKAMGGVVHNHHNNKIVNMYSKNHEYLKTFSSIREAARYIIKEYNLDPNNENGYSGHISAVCRGKRKTALGFIWEFANNN